MKNGRYSSSPYGKMRDRIKEKEEKKETRKKFPYKYILNT